MKTKEQSILLWIALSFSEYNKLRGGGKND